MIGNYFLDEENTPPKIYKQPIRTTYFILYVNEKKKHALRDTVSPSSQ